MSDADTGVPKVNAEATVDDPPEEGWVSYAWGPTDTDTSGNYKAEWEVDDNGLPRTFPPNSYIAIKIVDDLGDAPT